MYPAVDRTHSHERTAGRYSGGQRSTTTQLRNACAGARLCFGLQQQLVDGRAELRPARERPADRRLTRHSHRHRNRSRRRSRGRHMRSGFQRSRSHRHSRDGSSYGLAGCRSRLLTGKRCLLQRCGADATAATPSPGRVPHSAARRSVYATRRNAHATTTTRHHPHSTATTGSASATRRSMHRGSSTPTRHTPEAGLRHRSTARRSTCHATASRTT
jgi:hypothetical protein